MYNWQLPEWPQLSFDRSLILPKAEVFAARLRPLQKEALGLPEKDRFNFVVETLVQEAVNTSSIEGEFFREEDLKSSIINRLTIGQAGRMTRDLRIRGVGQLVELVRSTVSDPLTETMLKYWHEVLLNFDQRLSVLGDYRRGPDPMQIVSGPLHRPVVHFEAPAAEVVPGQMGEFVRWASRPFTDYADPLVSAAMRAGTSHVLFESIHPFEDGNGRIGRSIMEKILGQGLGSPVPFSLSRAIQLRQKDYYAALGEVQRTLDITEWLLFYFDALVTALDHSSRMIHHIVKKERFLNSFGEQLEPRHTKALLKMFGAGPDGFEGGMTVKKYVSINRVSPPTATRDLAYLTSIGAFERRGAGRSTHYVLMDMS